MELIDVVDDADRVVGRATRAVMRRDNLRHRAVYVVVRDTAGRVFVHQRTTTKDVYPGHWDVTIGGVVAAGEAYPEAALREVREEIGITPMRLDPLGPVRYEDDSTRVRGFAFATVHDGPVVLQASEIASGAFMALDAMERLIASAPFCPDGVAVFRAYVATPRP